MARFRTTRVQISGYRLLLRRLEEAFIRRDVRLLASPFTAQTTAMGVGMLIMALIGLAGIVVGWISPQAGVGNHSYVLTKDGGQYVKHNGTWHPVMNAASAKLILGTDAAPGVVDPDALSNVPLGLPMGIPSAPGQLNPSEEQTATASVCTAFTPASAMELTARDYVDTVAVIGDGVEGGDLLTRGKVSLVVDSQSRYHLLFDGKRSRIDMSDDKVRTGLGITAEVRDRAVKVSSKFIDAVPIVPEMKVPTLVGKGTSSVEVPGYRVGTLLTQKMPGEDTTFYVVALDGVQEIPEPVARILAADGHSIVESVNASVISSAGESSVIPVENFPSRMPEFLSGNSVCTTWTKTTQTSPATVTLRVSDTLPISEDGPGSLVPTISGGSGPSADYLYVTEARLLQATDLALDSVNAGPAYYITGNGVKHPIGTDADGNGMPTLETLGLTVTPGLVPHAILDLVPAGATLSQDNALTLHETIDPPDVQVAAGSDS